jgi:acyl-CoA thioesterase-1
MIIMRRIILALSVLALTACEAPEPAPADTAAPVARADSPVARADSPDSRAAAGAAARDSGAQPQAPGATRRIVFVGTSLTAGFGVGPELAYPALIQHRIDSAGLPFRVDNAGISGETSAGGLRRIDWSLQQPTAVLVLELGANDALRGLDPELVERNLDAVLKRARDLHPRIDIVLLGMEAPPNLGENYTQRFREIYTRLARRHGTALVPFLLDGVAGDPARNLDDGIHPNVEGQRIVAENVWEVLAPIIESHHTPGALEHPAPEGRTPD